ncbi:MAG TPA: extracellular solute-binding protein [Candidatus Binatia bacterium]
MFGSSFRRMILLALMILIGAARAECQDWKTKWEKILADAKKEGKVAVAGPPGTAYRDVMRGFEKKYPEIALEFQSFTPANFSARFSNERQAGQYLWDIYVTGPTGFDISAKKAGDLDPIRPLFILPEVLDEKAWFGGFDKAFLDSEKKYIFGFQAQITPQVLINREFVSEKDLNSIKGLLDSKWKGKIAINDPRVDGAGNGRIALWAGQLGEEFVRSLLKQDVSLSRDDRQLADWLARGKYPIAVGVNETDIAELQKLGVGSRVEPLGGKLAEAWRLSTGWGAARLVNKAPHINAATVYVNWLLSKEGQTAWASTVSRPSRRIDVPRVTGMSPEAGIDYFDIDREERVPLRDKAQEISKSVLR